MVFGGGPMEKKKLSKKFIWGFIVIIVIPTLFINSLIYSFMKERAIKNHSESMLKTMDYMAKSIETELKRLRLKTAVLVADKDIHRLLFHWKHEEDLVMKKEYEYELMGYITRRFDYLGDIDSAYFFLDQSDYFSYDGSEITYEGEIRNEDWYQAVKNKQIVNSLDPQNQYLKNIASANKVSFVTGVNQMDLRMNNHENENIEVVLVNYRSEVFKSVYSDLKDIYTGHMLLIDDFGNIVAASDNSLEGKSVSDLSLAESLIASDKQTLSYFDKDKEQMISVYHSPKSRWILVNYSDYHLITNTFNDLIQLFYLLFLMVIVMFIMFSLVFFRDIIKSIQSLMNKMKQVEYGNFHHRMEITGYGEIRELEYAFDNMIHKINLLMIERDQKEEARRKEEIKALQAQINPHFIYNTLNCIKIMSMMAQKYNITELTEAFMELLSGTFRDTRAVISIERELEYSKHYIHIMKVRYGDGFNVVWEIDDAINDYGILKLMLQPIIENAIIHGVGQSEGQGLIKIKAFIEDNNVCFEVEDNGPGMTKDQIEKLINGCEKKDKGLNKVGVDNVNRRIKLNYGDCFGLYIESHINEYTRVKIIIPMINL